MASPPSPNPVRSAPCLGSNGLGTTIPPSRERTAQRHVSSNNQTRARTRSAADMDEFQCPICMDTYIKVCETNCSHRFCRHCIETWFWERRSRVCPSCRTQIREISSLVDLEARIEDLVSQRFSDTQKQERETTKRAREEIRLRRHEEMNQELEHERLYEIQIPLMDGEYIESESDFGGQAPQEFHIAASVVPVQQITHFYSNTTGVYVPPRSEQYLRVGLGTPESLDTAEDDEEEAEPEEQEPLEDPGSRGSFEELEGRLNTFELRLREAQLSYNDLMLFLLENDRNGIFVRRIYDRFNALGMVNESQRAQWANVTPFDTRAPNAAPFSARSDMTSAPSSSSGISSRPPTNAIHLTPRTISNFQPLQIDRLPLDSTGWLTHLHNRRHSGSEAPGAYNAWENYVQSNPALDDTPGPTTHTETSVPASYPSSPAWTTRAESDHEEEETRRFSSPNYYSAGYHSFNSPSGPMGATESGDSLNVAFDLGGDDLDPNMNELNEMFRGRTGGSHSQDTRGSEYEDSEGQPGCCQHSHRCVTHGHARQMHDRHYVILDSDEEEDGRVSRQQAHEDSDEEEDGPNTIQIQFVHVVRPTAPVRTSYSADSN